MTQTIMVNSNDRETAKRLVMMLAAEGYSAIVLDNLIDFETKLNHCQIPLLIVDCVPACLEDTEPITMIRSIARNANNRCLILVPSEPSNMFKKLITDHHIAYLQKPILHVSFVRMVEQILSEPLSDAGQLYQTRNDI